MISPANSILTANINPAHPSPSTVSLVEEFIGGGATDTTVGALGWRLQAIGSTPTVTGLQPVIPQVGTLSFKTASGATQGQGGSLFLENSASSSGTLINNLQGIVGWEVQWIFQLSQTTNTRFRIGLDSVATTLTGSNGLHLRYDTNASFTDTNFIFESVAAGVATTVDSTIAVDTNWHRVKIYSTTAGTAIFVLYDATGAVLSTKTLAISITATNVGLSPVVLLGTDATAQKAMNLDYMSFFCSGLAR
jgi:hypothetical protein